LKANLSDRRRSSCVAMRERGGRTLTFVRKREADEASNWARRHVDPRPPPHCSFADESRPLG
jgi:hypothetical protein